MVVALLGWGSVPAAFTAHGPTGRGGCDVGAAACGGAGRGGAAGRTTARSRCHQPPEMRQLAAQRRKNVAGECANR